MVKLPEIIDIREYRKQSRRSGRARWILLLVFMLVCMITGYMFALSDFFSITHITVEGNEHTDEKRLIELSGFSVGNSIFSVSLSYSEQWLQIEPRVLSADVKRDWPNGIEINVVERKPVAMLKSGLAFIEVDATGRVLDRYQLAGSMACPLVTGIDLSESGITPGSYIMSDGMSQALDILEDASEVLDKIGEINVSDVQDIRLYTSSGIEVRLGDSSNFKEKYLLYSKIIEDHERNSNKVIDYIDVSVATKWAINYK